MPTNWIRVPYQSDQKYGTVPYAAADSGFGRVAAGHAALLGGGRPVLEAHPGVEDRVRPAREVPGGVDAGARWSAACGRTRRRCRARVRRSASQSVAGATPTPITTRSASIRVPSASRTADDVPEPSSASTADAAAQGRAVPLVQAGEHRAHRLTDRSGERGRHGLDDGDRRARAGGRTRRSRSR